MKKTVAGVLAVGVVWLTLTGSVWGEEILTLEKCIEAALKRSAEVRISRINLDQALLGVEKQEESKDWQAAFTSSFTRGFDNSFSYSKYYLATGEQDKIYNTEMFSSDFSNKVSISRSLKDYMTVNLYSKNTLTQGDGKSRKSGSMQESVLDQYPETVYETQKNYLEHGVELTIPLTGYERDKRMFDGDRNTFSVDSQELAYEKARHQVLEQVTAIYYSLVKNKMISGACQEEIDSFQKIIKLMNIQLERGMISVLDLQEQEIELQDKILKKDQAATDISLDCLKLSAETGFDINSKTQLVETFDLKPFRLDPAKVKELTFSNNRDLRQIFLERDRVQSELKEIDRKYKPSVNLSLNYNLDGQDRTFERAQDDYNPSYSAAVSMEYPFLNEGQIALERLIKVKEREKIEQKIEKTGQDIVVKVLDAVFRLEKIEKEYLNILSKIELTERNLKISEIRFEQGKIEKIDLLKMRFRLNSQKTSKLETIARYNSEVLKLKGYLDYQAD